MILLPNQAALALIQIFLAQRCEKLTASHHQLASCYHSRQENLTMVSGWYSLVFNGIWWYWMVLNGIGWYWMVLDVIGWYSHHGVRVVVPGFDEQAHGVGGGLEEGDQGVPLVPHPDHHLKLVWCWSCQFQLYLFDQYEHFHCIWITKEFFFWRF